MTPITISYLRHVFFAKAEGVNKLHQSKITDWRAYETWPEFVEGFLDMAVYPAQPSNKFETYGWTPTLFASSENKKGEWGLWRDGDYAADTLSLFVADMDNQHGDRTMVTIDELEATLKAMGLSYVLYTSFTHKPDHHKVRIVTPVTRDLTPDEAFSVFTVFNYLFGYQLDGSVYDLGDHLFGPPPHSDIRVELGGAALDVDAFLSEAEALPEEAKTFVKRAERHATREATPDELALMEAARNDPGIHQGVSIHNPHVFKPEWLAMLHDRYVGGSRNQSALGLLTKAWLKSGMTLSKGDLTHLQREMDMELGGYLTRTYGRHALERDVEAVMRVVGTQRPEFSPDQPATDFKTQLLNKELARIARRTRKHDDV